jgi:hypothetical protein
MFDGKPRPEDRIGALKVEDTEGRFFCVVVSNLSPNGNDSNNTKEPSLCVLLCVLATVLAQPLREWPQWPWAWACATLGLAVRQLNAK